MGVSFWFPFEPATKLVPPKKDTLTWHKDASARSQAGQRAASWQVRANKLKRRQGDPPRACGKRTCKAAVPTFTSLGNYVRPHRAIMRFSGIVQLVPHNSFVRARGGETNSWPNMAQAKNPPPCLNRLGCNKPPPPWAPRISPRPWQSRSAAAPRPSTLRKMAGCSCLSNKPRCSHYWDFAQNENRPTLAYFQIKPGSVGLGGTICPACLSTSTAFNWLCRCSERTQLAFEWTSPRKLHSSSGRQLSWRLCQGTQAEVRGKGLRSSAPQTIWVCVCASHIFWGGGVPSWTTSIRVVFKAVFLVVDTESIASIVTLCVAQTQLPEGPIQPKTCQNREAFQGSLHYTPEHCPVFGRSLGAPNSNEVPCGCDSRAGK